jgi:hypothetical protein
MPKLADAGITGPFHIFVFSVLNLGFQLLFSQLQPVKLVVTDNSHQHAGAISILVFPSV